MNGCQKELTGNLQVKRDKYAININFYDENGDRKPKQINTGLSVKGYNKRLAEDLRDLALHMLNNENADYEYVKLAVKKQAKVGDVPELGRPTGIVPMDDSAEAEIRRSTTAETAIAVYASGDGGNEGSSNDNPFIVPEMIMKIVGETPKPKVYRKSEWIGDKLPLVTYLRNWMDGQKHHVEHNTYASYDTQMSLRIIPFFNFFGLALSDLSHFHVKRFYQYILEAPRLDGKSGNVSNTTLHRVHSVFHKALNNAFTDEYIVSNPLAKVSPPRENDFHPNYYSAQQISTFIKYAKGDIAEIPLVLSFFFGTRRSETLGLKESSVDFHTNVIHITHTVTVGQRKYDLAIMDERGLVKKDRTKSKKSYRSLPVPEVFMAFLRKLVQQNIDARKAFGPGWNPEGYLCVTKDGKLIHPNTMSKHFKIICAKAGLPVNRLHDARHSVASLMIQNGTDIYVIKEYLGHADIQTTTRYSHLRTEHLAVSANLVQRLITSEGISLSQEGVWV
ncbi:site-specific integrase [Ruminococcaceae bacterium OttesenSCG-928-D13]|nr:site-specific integrase [Ruminococcaceae bacterium OttesenSCG-928-D13]